MRKMGKLNSKLNLRSGIFSDKKQEVKATRDGYGEGLLEIGEKNMNIVALSADLAGSTRAQGFKEKFSERFVQVGVAEQNLATVAAGLGISGKIPFISSFSAFSPGRNWEQIRTTIAYNNSNVKIAGSHAGFSPGPDGATHQAMEDIATMRSIPNMRVFVPCDAEEAKKITIASANIIGPTYIRLSRDATPLITTEKTPFIPERMDKLWESKNPDALIVSCGVMVYESLLAAQLLKEEGIEVVVLNAHTIKPLDDKTLIKEALKAGAVVTAEEHSVIGGLGGAVAEVVVKNNPLPMELVGVQDTFGESGDSKDLRKKYGLTAEDVVKATKKVISRKKS